MKKSIAVMLFILVFALPVVTQEQEGFTVEQLSPAETEKLQKAELEFKAAESKHSSEIYEVQRAHGQSLSTWGRGFWGTCGTIVTQVELRGKYALITRTKDTSGCPVMANYLGSGK